jgi:hypothetical protein
LRRLLSENRENKETGQAAREERRDVAKSNIYIRSQKQEKSAPFSKKERKKRRAVAEALE